MNWYYCSKCNSITQRDSENTRIKSTCKETGARSFLVKIDNADELAIKLRKKFLKNMIDLKSFSRHDRYFLEMTFEQGAKVVFNAINQKQ